MTTTSPSLEHDGARIDHVARQLLAAVQELESALGAEADALTSGDAGALLSAVERKRSALASIDRVAREQTVMSLLHASSSQSNGNDAASRLKQRPEWSRLLDALVRCRDLNQAAGGAIAASRRSTDELLRALGHGHAPTTYDLGGQAAAAPAGRDLAVC